MLLLSKISHKSAYTEDWKKERLGMITASPFGKLVSRDGSFTVGGMTYLYGLAGERITGESSSEEFFTDATNHGNATEPESIMWAAKKIGMDIIRDQNSGQTHRLVVENDFLACTPDALLVDSSVNIFSQDGESLLATPLEVKSPLQHHRFIKLLYCNTPEDLKKADPLYFWQVMFQMFVCKSLTGYFAVYSPFFGKHGSGNVIKFEKLKLLDDFRTLRATADNAVQEIKNIVEFINSKKS